MLSTDNLHQQILIKKKVVSPQNFKVFRLHCVTKKYDLLVTKRSLSVLVGNCAADSESEVGFALSRQNFEFFKIFPRMHKMTYLLKNGILSI